MQGTDVSSCGQNKVTDITQMSTDILQNNIKRPHKEEGTDDSSCGQNNKLQIFSK